MIFVVSIPGRSSVYHSADLNTGWCKKVKLCMFDFHIPCYTLESISIHPLQLYFLSRPNLVMTTDISSNLNLKSFICVRPGGFNVNIGFVRGFWFQ